MPKGFSSKEIFLAVSADKAAIEGNIAHYAHPLTLKASVTCLKAASCDIPVRRINSGTM